MNFFFFFLHIELLCLEILDFSEFVMVTKSSAEDGSVFEVPCDSGFQQKPAAPVADGFLTDPTGKSLSLYIQLFEYISLS